MRLRYWSLVLMLVFVAFTATVAEHSETHAARLYVANSRGNDVLVI